MQDESARLAEAREELCAVTANMNNGAMRERAEAADLKRQVVQVGHHLHRLPPSVCYATLPPRAVSVGGACNGRRRAGGANHHTASIAAC